MYSILKTKRRVTSVLYLAFLVVFQTSVGTGTEETVYLIFVMGEMDGFGLAGIVDRPYNAAERTVERENVAVGFPDERRSRYTLGL